MPEAGPRDDPFGDGRFGAPRVLSPHAVNFGADFAYGVDPTVRAGLGGRVVFSGEFAPGEIAGNKGRGYAVITESRIAEEYAYTIYSHLEPGTAVGREVNVRAGDPIGRAGDTGSPGALVGQPGFQPYVNIELWDMLKLPGLRNGGQNIAAQLGRRGRVGTATRLNPDVGLACRKYAKPKRVVRNCRVDKEEEFLTEISPGLFQCITKCVFTCEEVLEDGTVVRRTFEREFSRTSTDRSCERCADHKPETAAL